MQFSDTPVNMNRVDKCMQKLDEFPKLHKIGKREIVKNYRQDGILKDFFNKYFEQWENDINEIIFGKNKDNKIKLKHLIKRFDIKKFVGILNPPDVSFHYDKGEIITSLFYFLPDYEKEIIVIELDDKLQVRDIKYNI